MFFVKSAWKTCKILFLSVFLLAALGACGGYNRGETAQSSSSSQSYDTDYESPGADSAESEAAAPENGLEESALGEGAVPRAENRKLITTVNLTAETKEYDSFLTWLEGRVAEAGGYVETSDLYAYSEDSRSCQLKLRIPAEKLNGFLAEVGENCHVLQRSTQEEDVTLEYVDAESYRDALLAEQKRLMELLEQASSLEDILNIEDRLTNVRYQLQNYESTLRVYDSQINYSTVYFSLEEVRELTEPEPENWGSRAWAGMKNNAKDLGRFFQELGLFFVTHLPTLVFFLIIAGVILLLTAKPRRRARERRREQKALIQARRQEAMEALRKAQEQRQEEEKK